MLDFKNKQCDALTALIAESGHFYQFLDNEFVCTDEAAIQAIIDNYVPPVPNLTPRQFEYFLVCVGLDVVVRESVKYITDKELQAQVSSELKRGTVYFWDRSVQLFRKIKPILKQLAPNLELDNEEGLKIAWLLATKV